MTNESRRNMRTDKTRRIFIGICVPMTVLALLAVPAAAQTSTTTRTHGTATTTTKQERGTVVYVEGNTVVVSNVYR
jgi:predicted S18 family serine protease